MTISQFHSVIGKNTRRIRLPERVRPLFIASLLTAVCSCFGPRLFQPYTTSFDFALLTSVCLSGFWVLLVCLSVAAYRKRGLWLLIGAPLALYYPYAFLVWGWACRQNVNACP